MKTRLLIFIAIIISIISVVSILMNVDQAFAFCDAHSEPCFERIKTFDKIDDHFVRNYFFDYADDVFVHYDWPNKSDDVANNFDGFPAVYCFEIIANDGPHFLMTNWIDPKNISNIVDMYVPELCEQSINPINSENRPDSLYVNKPVKTEKDFHEGTVEWISQCNLVVSNAIVRITDRDMNKDPKQIDQFSIEVWSNSENRIKEYTVTETGNDTGIFDSIIFLTIEESPGRRVVASAGDILFAKYVDQTLPDANKKVEITDMFVVDDLFVPKQNSSHQPLKLNYDPCTIMYFEEFPERAVQHVIFYPPPLKQLSSGILIDEIQCKESLTLVTKNNGSPACVTPETRQNLIDRGWAKYDAMLQKVFDLCGCQESGGPCINPIFKWENETHHIDSVSCKWTEMENEN